MRELTRFLERVQAFLPAGSIDSGEGVLGRLGTDMLGEAAAPPAAVIRPDSVDAVSAIVALANELRVPIYPVSTGHNWGYGGAWLPRSGAAVLELSRLCEIDAEQMDLGVVRVQPGVTQQQLAAFLAEQGYQYLVPVHGGGPTCSLIGNALERGYGITPTTDHFAAVTGFTVVLPDGRVFRGPMAEVGGKSADALFKWGVGPYLDGIFTQGSFGVVVEATLALVPKPPRVESFIFSVREGETLGAAVTAVNRILSKLPGVVGGINLMNARRVLSMMAPYDDTALDSDGVMSQQALQRLAKENRVTAWTGFGTLYGEAAVVRASKKVIRRQLKGVTRSLRFVQPHHVQRAAALVRRLPLPGLHRYLSTVSRSLQLVAGTPGEVALPLAYWRQGGPPRPEGLNPAKDGCGLIWFAPLVPMRAEAAEAYVRLVEAICRRHRIEPLITLTSLSSRCFDSTLPILFDPSDSDEVSRAHACYQELLAAGRAEGFLPYRYPVHAMQQLAEPHSVYWGAVEALKAALDPHGILSPGRYDATPGAATKDA